MKRILVANIFGIGDVLFTTPLIACLKKGLKEVSVDYLCNARTKDIVKSDPDIDDVLVYEKDDLVKLWNGSKISCIKTVYSLFSDIRSKRYDVVFDFTLSREFGLFFKLSGIPKRVGLDYKNRGLFLTDKKPLTGFEGRHVVEHYLDLLDFLDVTASVREMRLIPDEKSLEWASDYISDRSAENGPLIAMIPGGGASWGQHALRKRWEAKGFSRVADILAGQGARIGVFGDASESELCREVSDSMTMKPFAVESSLPLKEYMALLSKFDLILCNDGGPLHIAVALGIKTVSIFGPVDDKVYGPYPVLRRHKTVKAEEIPCRPCYNRFKLPACENDMRCLTDIDPEAVADTCLELLKE